MSFVQSWNVCAECASKANVDRLLWLYHFWSWTKPPHPPYTYQGPQNRPRMKPEAGVATQVVKGACLCKERKRTEGSLLWCIWLTPGAALAVGWLQCRPFGIRWRHSHMFSLSAGSAGSSPWSVFLSLSSATYTCSTHNLINMSANQMWLHNNVQI